jgi:hypothetical protein
LPPNLQIYCVIVAPWAGFSYVALACWDVYALGVNLTIFVTGLILLPPLLCLTGVLVVKDIRRDLAAVLFNQRVIGAFFVATAVFGFLSIPLLRHDAGLTSISLYNHDVANYATDSRFLVELVASSPAGFIEQKAEAFRLCPVQCYLGPVSFAAFLSVACHLMPHHTTTLCVNLFGALAVASLFLVLRDVFKTRTLLALLGAALFGFHPLFTYVVWQGFFAQTVTTGLALMIFWVQGRLLDNESSRRTVCHLTLLLVFFTVTVLLSYQHMLPFVWGFAGVYAIVIALHRRSTQPIWRAVGPHLAAFILAGVLCPARAIAFVSLLNTMAGLQAGYFLPFFSPDYVAGLSYQNAPFEIENPTFHQIAMISVMIATFVSLLAAFKYSDGESRGLWIACLIVYGGALVLGLDARHFAGGQYKSFKVVGFFLPFFVASFVCLMRVAVGSRNKLIGTISVLALIALSTGYSRADGRLLKAVRTAKLLEHDYQDLLAVDKDPQVDSVNLVGHDGWENMWAAYFLMHKKVFFEAPNYWLPQSLEGNYDVVDVQANLAIRHLPTNRLPPVRRLNDRFYLIGPLPPG